MKENTTLAVTSPSEVLSFPEVKTALQEFLGEDLLSLEEHTRVSKAQDCVPLGDLWIEVPRLRFMEAVEFLGTLDFPHFHVISGNDEGEKVMLNYHFSLYRAAGFETQIGVSVKVRLSKDMLSMPSLWPMIPGVEYSEREILELYGVDFVGLENKNLVFLPEDWDRSVFPKRRDETGLKPEHIRKLS
jgi:membrane-bound hydrogenase subunit beta